MAAKNSLKRIFWEKIWQSEGSNYSVIPLAPNVGSWLVKEKLRKKCFQVVF